MTTGPRRRGGGPRPPGSSTRRAWTRLALGAVVAVAVLGTAAGAQPTSGGGAGRAGGTGAAGPAAGSGGGRVVIAAVGDMACAPDAAARARRGGSNCQQDAVSDAVLASRPAALLALGDEQYERGGPDWGPYDRSYGRLRGITRPVPGNHEYLTPAAASYHRYFGERAAPTGTTYYSFDLGGWHLVALDSQCREVDGCGDGSPQLDWLADDLIRDRSRCTLAYWHIPRFSSGQHGDSGAYRTLWRLLATHGVDLVISGHDHNYERLAPLAADGARAASGVGPTAGIRSFVVGTGGRNLRPVGARRPGSEKVIADAFGFLEVGLRGDGYSWRFVGADRQVLDEGADRCH
jgi:acid phosphatase type 7